MIYSIFSAIKVIFVGAFSVLSFVINLPFLIIGIIAWVIRTGIKVVFGFSSMYLLFMEAQRFVEHFW